MSLISQNETKQAPKKAKKSKKTRMEQWAEKMKSVDAGDASPKLEEVSIQDEHSNVEAIPLIEDSNPFNFPKVHS